jgi:hypothetical protein
MEKCAPFDNMEIGKSDTNVFCAIWLTQVKGEDKCLTGCRYRDQQLLSEKLSGV